MSGVNKAIIIGRLGTDPEIRQVSSGQTMATLSVATSEAWNDKNGQKQERKHPTSNKTNTKKTMAQARHAEAPSKPGYGI